MKTSDSIKQIAPAVVTVQANIKMALKESTNPHFKSKFANLESVWDACREPLKEAGLAAIQTFDVIDGKSCLSTMLLHTSGEWIMGTQLLNEIKQDPQASASASTYARRYGLSAMLGIIQTDDDGEQAMGRAPSKDINKDAGFAMNALVSATSKDEARKVWMNMIAPIFNQLDVATQDKFNEVKNEVVRKFQ